MTEKHNSIILNIDDEDFSVYIATLTSEFIPITGHNFYGREENIIKPPISISWE